MILTCPQCATRYETDAALFAAGGRKVRCAKCGHVWHQATDDAPAAPEPELTPFDEPEPPAAPPPAPVPPPRMAYAPSASIEPAVAPVFDEKPQGRTVRGGWVHLAVETAGWAALAALVLAIGWSAMHFRQQIATIWPQSASFYAALGRPVNITGLEIRTVQYRIVTEDGQPVLAITGTPDGITTHDVTVPQLRATLTDSDKRVLYNWTFSAGVTALRPSEGVDFHTRLPGPPSGDLHLQVRVAENGK